MTQTSSDFLAAAKSAGVKVIVRLSSFGIDARGAVASPGVGQGPLGDSHARAEAEAAAAGLVVTSVRPTSFTSNFLRRAARPATASTPTMGRTRALGSLPPRSRRPFPWDRHRSPSVPCTTGPSCLLPTPFLPPLPRSYARGTLSTLLPNCTSPFLRPTPLHPLQQSFPTLSFNTPFSLFSNGNEPSHRMPTLPIGDLCSHG
mmetsp:Transcript_21902/g.52337  ORF Transcript_21902/g.52337 Transcript_21902/m.52337 type:complete len:202 (-) Transcript_21902:745-1350(-)